jgi:restriction system protein
VRAGYLESSHHGVWNLTEKGAQTDLAKFDVYEVFQLVQKGETADYKSELLAVIKSLPPNGFERLCQRVLHESGFQEVAVSGRTGDGGIDEIGVLQVTPFVSFNVLFQCKHYQGSVTPSQVRDFRGAMARRADKGIMMTTGTFAVEAKKEARRDGAAAIELVAGEDLVKLFEDLELGLLSDGFLKLTESSSMNSAERRKTASEMRQSTWDAHQKAKQPSPCELGCLLIVVSTVA